MEHMKKRVRVDMIKILSNPKYQGLHVIVLGEKVFTARTGKRASQILRRIERESPRETPAITYVPKSDTLILWL